MKILILAIVVLSAYSSAAQERFKGIVVDETSLNPIEFACITDGMNRAQTNSEGKFDFISGKDSVLIEKLGYKHITLYQYDKDTIKLPREVIELREIVISNTPALLKKAYQAIPENYPLFPFKEKFFLRCLLKKNGAINKLEDMYGLVERKTLFQTTDVEKSKNNYSVELFNLRKAGIREREIDFELYSFKKLFEEFSSFYLNPKLYHFKEEIYSNNDHTKISFTAKNQDEYLSSGYLIINNKDYAMLEVFGKHINTKNHERKGKIRSKTTWYEINIFFNKKQDQPKYTIDRSKFTAQAELYENPEELIIYDCTFLLNTFENFTQQAIRKEVSVSKDIFKLDGDYNPAFWADQQWLPLTREMQLFIDETKKDKKKFISNF